MFTTTSYLNKIEEEIDFAGLDYKEVHKQLRETLYRQRQLKKEMDTSEPGLSTDTQLLRYYERLREFNSLSSKMTKLCCLLAHSKGKLHMKKARQFFNLQETVEVTLDMQRKTIGNFWKDYVVK